MRSTFRSRKPCKRTIHCKPNLEQLEDRIVPIVGQFSVPGEALGFDGVVRLSNSAGGCTGTLLSTGRHILTAAHCLTDDRGNIDSALTNVSFEFPGRTLARGNAITLTVPRVDYHVHPKWNGDVDDGNDIAVLELPELAPSGPSGTGAFRHEIYRNNDEARKTFRVVGYGDIGTGQMGAVEGSGTVKRAGLNRFDLVGETALGYDFDSGHPNNDLFGRFFDIPDNGVFEEVGTARGDSGGPSFLGSLQIAGVTSFRSAITNNPFAAPWDTNPGVNSSFGDYFAATRVSAFARWIDDNVGGSYELILDMNNQRFGNSNDGRTHTIEVRKTGTGGLATFNEVWVNGQLYHSDFARNISSIVIRGSNDNENLTVAADIGKLVTFDGGGGGNLLSVSNASARSEIDVFGGIVGIKTGGGQSFTIFTGRIQRISVEGDAQDVVNVSSVRSDLPVSVIGAGTVAVPNTEFVDGNLSVLGRGVTNLTITASSRGVYFLDGAMLTAPSAGLDIDLDALRSLTINGSGGGNGFIITGTPAPTVTLNTGTGADFVTVRGTHGALTINGQDGADTVDIGNNFSHSVRFIRGLVTITNARAHSAVTVDDAAETAARTVILYANGADNIISGLGSDIVLRSFDLSSLTLHAGSGNNTFRIHDTPRSSVEGGLATTIYTGTGRDNITVNGTRGALILDLQDESNDITVGSAVTGLDQIKGNVFITSSAAGAYNRVSINDAPTQSGRSLTHTVGARSYSRTGAAGISMFNIHEFYLQTGAAADTFDIQGIPANGFTPAQIFSGDGNDIFNIGQTLNRLATIGRLNIDGQNHSDIVNFLDSANTAQTNYNFDVMLGWGYLSTPGATIGFVNAEGAILQAGSAGNDVVVRGTLPGTLRLNLGAGDDRVDVGSAGNLLNTVRSLSISDRAGADQLVLRDYGQSTARSYTFRHESDTFGTFQVRDTGSSTSFSYMEFYRLESLTLHAGSASDTFRIGGSPLGGTLAVHAGAGDDSFVVASEATYDSEGLIFPENTLGRIRGALVLDGQDDADSVLFNDQNTASGQTYEITASSLVRTGTALMSHANIERVDINGSAGNDVFKVGIVGTAPSHSIHGRGGVNTLDYSAYPVSGSPPAAEPVPPRLSWYRADGDYSDAAGSNNGTPNNGVTFGPGHDGQAFNFDGIDDYIDLGNDPTLDLPGSVTFAAWVNYQPYQNPNGYVYLLADFNTGGTISQGSLGLIGARFFWYQNMEDGSALQFTGVSDLAPDEWYHVAVVRDDFAKTVRLYVNGVQDGQASYAGTVVGLQQTRVLGTSLPAGFPDDFFAGGIDDLSIFACALTPGQIQTLSGGGRIGTLGSGVVVNLPLGTATALTGGITNIQNVIGSAGNDTLVGIGGNILTGGAGRDLLIAGELASVLAGGEDDDLLIGGTTIYDRDPYGLDAIMAVWTSNDDYATRVAALRTGLLGAGTVTINGRQNTLQGQEGRDFFFASLVDLLDDADDEDVVWFI